MSSDIDEELVVAVVDDGVLQVGRLGVRVEPAGHDGEEVVPEDGVRLRPGDELGGLVVELLRLDRDGQVLVDDRFA